MKTRHLIFPFVIFAIFVLAGHWTGKQIERSVSPSELTVTETDRLVEQIAQIEAGNNDHSYAPQRANDLPLPTSEQQRQPLKQKNTLIIGVDRLASSRPSLEAVWLVLYLPDMPHITLMPLYPSVRSNGHSLEVQIDDRYTDLFRMALDGTPDSDFLEFLDAQGIWWTSYIVMDGSALAGIVDFSGGLADINGSREQMVEKSDSGDALATIPMARSNPQEALDSQARLFQHLCHNSTRIDFSVSRIEKLFLSLRKHMKTNLTPHQVIGDIESMLAFGGGFVCEFPSLMIAPTTQ